MSGTLPQGGTYLGTSRTNPFKIENGVDRVRENIKKFELDAIITIGGDDTNGVSNKLSQFGIKGVGIPQTIDNDIAYSDYSIGFDSALEVVTDAIDRLHTTASSHHRVMIVEVMGRDAGWLALHGGLAGGADVILIPEVPFDYDEIIDVIQTREQRGKDFSIIVVAEGAKPKDVDKQITASGKVDNFGHVQLGGIGEVVSEEIEKRSGHECRVTVLGHVQRGGRPTAFDRILATRLGSKAVDMIKEEDFGKMACFKDNKIIAVPLKKAIEERKPMDMELYQLSKLFH
ncbi:MAG: ATP-dependent 6-phosphofructokinase [Actinomycetota bacterium]|nr:ATP-dependent 6-phosphofructokinase [Actinomycetota bacterium]